MSRDTTLTIYHNPKCSKSRQTLSMLTEAGLEPRIVRYLDNPPSQGELRRLCGLLGIAPGDLLRKGEDAYVKLGLDREGVSDEKIVSDMHNHPILIQRPIVVAGNAARIGRPPEAVLEIITRDTDA